MSTSAAMRIRGLLLAMLGLFCQAVVADVFDELEFHGFATQGFVHTSANSFFGDSERGSFDFREIGVNATFEPLSNLRLSGQLLSRRAGELSSGSPNVDYALADFTLRSTAEHRLSVILGRIKNPLGLYNETRDVAFTRPSVFVPQSIYFDRVRNLLPFTDGVGVRNEWYGECSKRQRLWCGWKALVRRERENMFTWVASLTVTSIRTVYPIWRGFQRLPQITG